jgi:hypothetical protein
MRLVQGLEPLYRPTFVPPARPTARDGITFAWRTFSSQLPFCFCFCQTWVNRRSTVCPAKEMLDRGLEG